MATYVKTRTGRELNADLLSLGELKQIKRTHGILPQEFVRSAESQFIFRVRDPRSGSMVETGVEKTNLDGAFQGLYSLPDGRFIVLRSQYRPGRFIEWAFKAEMADFIDGRLRELANAAHFRYFPAKKGDRDLSIDHRIVERRWRMQGIGSIMVERLEKHAGACGCGRISIVGVVESPMSGRKAETQADVIEAFRKRGYTLEKGRVGETNLVRGTYKASPDDNLATHHKFPVSSNERNSFHSEPIK